MMSRLTIVAAFAVVGTIGATPAFAEIKVESAWVRATPGQMKISAGYAHISNTGAQPDRLLSVSMPATGSVQVHQTTRTDGMMNMEAVDALEIPAGKAVDLAPGGYHLMIMGLTHPLTAGDTVAITFHFDKAGDITAPAKVAPLAATKAP